MILVCHKAKFAFLGSAICSLKAFFKKKNHIFLPGGGVEGGGGEKAWEEKWEDLWEERQWIWEWEELWEWIQRWGGGEETDAEAWASCGSAGRGALAQTKYWEKVEEGEILIHQSRRWECWHSHPSKFCPCLRLCNRNDDIVEIIMYESCKQIWAKLKTKCGMDSRVGKTGINLSTFTDSTKIQSALGSHKDYIVIAIVVLFSGWTGRRPLAGTWLSCKVYSHYPPILSSLAYPMDIIHCHIHYCSIVWPYLYP